VGLPLEFYNDTGIISSYCGTYIVVTNPINNETVTARVADASAQNQTLSLSIGTWNALQGTATDLTVVHWRFANSTEVSLVESQLKAASLIAALTPGSASSSSSSSPVVVAGATPAVVPSTQSTKAGAAASPIVNVAPVVASPVATTPAPVIQAAPVAAAPVTSTPVASSSSYGGSATYYTRLSIPATRTNEIFADPVFDFAEDGAVGACGHSYSDLDFIVALPVALYSAANCGRSVLITRTATGQSVRAIVADKCPVSSHSLAHRTDEKEY